MTNTTKKGVEQNSFLEQVPKLDVYINQIERFSSPKSREITTKLANERRNLHLSIAEYEYQCSQMKERWILHTGEPKHPTNNKTDGSFWETRRWPWAVFWPTGYNVHSPPWIGRHPKKHLHDIVNDCLSYCLKNKEFLPSFAPVMGHSIFHNRPQNAVSKLPDLTMVLGPFIPEGIVRLHEQARCGECLAFISLFTGNVAIDAIRRLISAPSPERIAEAYAISTSKSFRSKKMIKLNENIITIERGSLKLMADIRSQYSDLLVGYSNNVLAQMLAQEKKDSDAHPNGWDVSLMADELKGDSKRGSGPLRTGIPKAFKTLLKLELVESIGRRKFFQLGPAAYNGEPQNDQWRATE